MANAKTKSVKISAYMRMKGFTVGVNSVRKGKAFNPDQYEDRSSQWRYEVGRQFAYVYDGPVKLGNKIHWAAINAMNEALMNREICA